jgi:hypothetical protein
MYLGIMPKRSSKRKPPGPDENQLAALIVEQATEPALPPKNPAAVALGRLGGLKGGPARAKRLNKKRRSEIAAKAAKARWKKKRKKPQSSDSSA